MTSRSMFWLTNSPSSAALDNGAGHKRRTGRAEGTTWLARFMADEDGAVTVDWLALTASAFGVGLLGVSIVGQSVTASSEEIVATLRAADLGRITFVETSPNAGSVASSTSVGG